MNRLARVVSFLAAASIMGAAMPSQGDVFVSGYTKRDGTYVQPHYRSSPNGTPSDNWSSRGNQNPHTGKVGTKSSGADFGSYNSRTSSARLGYSLPRIPQTMPMLRSYFE